MQAGHGMQGLRPELAARPHQVADAVVHAVQLVGVCYSPEQPHPGLHLTLHRRRKEERIQGLLRIAVGPAAVRGSIAVACACVCRHTLRLKEHPYSCALAGGAQGNSLEGSCAI